MRTIAVVNQKGGCGKTITSINLSAFLAREQRRVLLVDMDPQGHTTLGLLTDAVHPSRTMYEVFVEEPGERPTVLRDVILTVRENLDLAPADILLSGVPEALAGQIGREDILSDALVRVRDDYDYVIVDCPPSVGLLTFNALKACSEAIVPVDPIAHYCEYCVGFEDYQALANEVLLQEAARAEDGSVAVERDVILMSAGADYREPLAPAVTSKEVVFAIDAPHAAQVQVMGDFNDWNLEGSEMEPVGGTWKKVVTLPPGRYRYRYIVDDRWQSDPLNVTVEPNPYGGLDSILVVDEELAG